MLVCCHDPPQKSEESTYLGESSSNGSLATLLPESLFLCLGNNGLSIAVFRRSFQAGEVAASRRSVAAAVALASDHVRRRLDGLDLVYCSCENNATYMQLSTLDVLRDIEIIAIKLSRERDFVRPCGKDVHFMQ